MAMRTRSRQGKGSMKWAELSQGHRILCGLLAVLQILIPCLAAALPTDGQVAGGQATIQQTNPKALTIQQGTDKAILNWKSFSIAADESVRFVQPSINSIALNRVIGVDPSVILGRLQSNGRIFLINPNGILFGAGAQINVGGLLATTLQIRDDDFMAGRFLFAQDPLKSLKSVVNQGTIHVSDHGFVVLAAPGASNEGMIVANLGTTILASGKTLTVDMMGDGLINYAITGKVLDQVIGPDGKPLSSAVKNSGTIQADGGQVIMAAKASSDIFSSVVNQSGIVRARSLENHGGIVKLIGGDDTLAVATAAGAMRPAGEVSGAVINTGTIDVSAGVPNASQGSVTMVGERVGQLGTILATGANGANGGEVVIASTTRTVLASGSSIDVSGIGQSSGGRLRVWSDQDTFFDSGATILARGGELGGNGGFIELSGKENLGYAGIVNALAPFGLAGTLLLDPRNITIATAGGAAYNSGTNNLFANTPAADVIITPASINAAAANVILQANNDITVTNAVAMTNNGIGLTMQAGRDINVNANISTTNGNIALTANDASALGANRTAGTGDIVMAAGTTINSRGGNISLTIGPSAVAPFSPGGITAAVLTTTGLANQNAGNITINTPGAVTVSGAITANGGTAGAGNPGRNGGMVTITGATGISTGAITANGSNGNGANQAGGNGGTINITKTSSGNVTSGALVASGGNAGTGTANGGTGGTISVSNNGTGNMTVGSLTARSGNAIGTGSSAAGSVAVTSSAVGGSVQAGAINTVGGNNGTGGNVTLSSAGVLQFAAASTIQTTGGTALAGNAGRAGGTVALSGTTVTTTGAITANGSNGNGANQAGGNAGNITVTSTGALNLSAGTLTASGGNAGTGNAAGGNGGMINLTNSSATTGGLTTNALTARNGNAVGTGAGGAVGTVTVTQNNATAGATLQTAAINTSGSTKGAGGAVVLNSLSNVNVTSTITTSGGAAVAGGTHAGAAAGNVTITGLNRTVTGLITANGGTAVGVNQVGGNAGVVSSAGTGTSSTTAGVTASTGAATGTGAGGAAGSITLGGTTISSGALTTSGGVNGNGGNVSVTATTGTSMLSTIRTSGGTANANTAGRNAGTVIMAGAGGLTATTITANGSNGNGANFSGGTGGTVSGTSTGGNVTVGAISTIGGSGLAGNANGGNGGAVTLDAGGATPTITHQNITTTGGNRIGNGTAGAGGAVSVVDAALLSANTVITATGGNAGVGTGGNVTFGGTVNGNAAGRTLAVNTNGQTTFSGAVGGVTPLASLTTDAAGLVRIGSNVTTTGVQTYNDPLTLIGNSIMAGTTPAFGSTVAGGGFNLTLNFSGTTTINGANFTGINNFVSGNGGTTNLTGAFATLGSQTYNDVVALTGGTTLASSGNQAITFNSTINGAQTLALNTTGTTNFGGAVGGTTALTSLITNAGGSTAINGGSIRTSGNQTYNDDATMNQATTLTSTGGTITISGNAINNTVGGALTVDAPAITLAGGRTIATTGNGSINFFTDTLNPNGASINAGTGMFSLAPNVLTRTIEFGDVNTGRVTDVFYGLNFAGVTAGSFTIGRPTHTGNIFVTGVATAPSAINIVNGGTGSVIFENASYVSGSQNLGVLSGSGGISMGSNLTLGTGTLRLTTAGAITQTTGTITANTAGLSAATGITLTQPANNVTTVAAQTAAGNINYRDTDGLTIGSVSATADGFHPAIAGLTANAGTITFQSGGLITQTQRILASALNLQGSGTYQLTNGANDVSTLAANTTGNVQYTDTNALSLGASTVSGSLNVITGGALTQSGAVTVAGATTLAAGAANDITLTNASNNFSTVGITSGNNVTLTDVNALTMNASTVAGSFSVSAVDLTIGSALASTSGALNLTGTNTVTQSANLTASGVNNILVTATTGPITMAPGAMTTSGTGAINYTAGTDVTLGSLMTAGAVNVIANGGSVLSAAGSGTNVTAGSNSSLQAFNGVVGTQAAPLTVSVNPGTLSIRATTAPAGISAFLTGTVLPSNALTLLNVPSGLVCFNGCPVTSGTGGLASLLVSAYGTLAYLNRDAIVPTYYPKPSGAMPITQVASEYVPGTVMAASDVSVAGDQQSVARAVPPCFGCVPGEGILTAPAEGTDPEAPQPGLGTAACRKRDRMKQGLPEDSKSPATENRCEELVPAK